jgi:hypothetical protein
MKGVATKIAAAITSARRQRRPHSRYTILVGARTTLADNGKVSAMLDHDKRQEGHVADKTDPFEFRAVTRQALEQTHHAVDAYFDILKEVVTALPSGGTELGERMKAESVENLAAVQALAKRLSEAKDFQEALAIQTAFIHSQLNVFAKRALSVGQPLGETREVPVKQTVKWPPT